MAYCSHIDLVLMSSGLPGLMQVSTKPAAVPLELWRRENQAAVISGVFSWLQPSAGGVLVVPSEVLAVEPGGGKWMPYVQASLQGLGAGALGGDGFLFWMSKDKAADVFASVVLDAKDHAAEMCLRSQLLDVTSEPPLKRLRFAEQ